MEKVTICSTSELSALIEESIEKVLFKKNIIPQQVSQVPELLSIDLASKYLNLARQTLYGFTSNRSIPFIKRGKKLYFKKSDLDSWLGEGRRRTLSELGGDITKAISKSGDQLDLTNKTIKKSR